MRSMVAACTVFALAGIAPGPNRSGNGSSASAPILPGSDVIQLGAGSFARAISAWRHVVGSRLSHSGTRQAFLWQHGTMRDLGTLERGPSEESFGTGVNSSGQVVGDDFLLLEGTSAFLPDFTPTHEVGFESPSVVSMRAFLWEQGSMRDLGTLGGPNARATGINESGQVVGYSSTLAGGDHAFLWQDGAMQDLGTLPGDFGSYAFAINDSGHVVGISRNSLRDHAVIWRDGVIQDLGTIPSSRYSAATNINNAGQVAGFSGTWFSGPKHALRWQADGTVEDLGTFGLFDGVETWGINDDGQVVGFGSEGGSSQRSFFWSPTDGMEDLTSATGLRVVTGIQGLTVVGGLSTGEGAIVKVRFQASQH